MPGARGDLSRGGSPRLNVFVVSNGSRPIRPPGISNVSMILVGDSADAADDWIAERVAHHGLARIPVAAVAAAAAGRVALLVSQMLAQFSAECTFQQALLEFLGTNIFRSRG